MNQNVDFVLTNSPLDTTAPDAVVADPTGPQLGDPAVRDTGLRRRVEVDERE